MKDERERREEISDLSPIIIMAVTAIALLPVLLLSVLSSLVVPGGVFTRMLGHAVVRNDAREIGRVLSLTRVLVAWMPAIAWRLYLTASPRVQGFVPTPPEPAPRRHDHVRRLAIGALLTTVRPNEDHTTGCSARGWCHAEPREHHHVCADSIVLVQPDHGDCRDPLLHVIETPAELVLSIVVVPSRTVFRCSRNSRMPRCRRSRRCAQ